MPRYNYTSPFQCLDRQSSYSFRSSSLDAAVASARAQHPRAMIKVKADCRIWNAREKTDVFIYAWQTEGKTRDEIYELFDLQVDGVIARRHQSEHRLAEMA